jgi:muconate cycloisomerase
MREDAGVMAKLRDVDTFIVDIPTIRPHVLAMATMCQQSIVIVRIRDADGFEGIGEGTTIGGLSYGAESPESIKSAIDTYMKPLLEVADLENVRSLMLTIARFVKGNHIAKCAVETALFDLLGKRLGCPVSDLLGGGRVRSSMPVAWTLASGDTAVDVEEAEKVIAQKRHRIFKLKIGKRDVVDDVAHVAAICAAVGDRGSVRVDVNQNWNEAQADRAMSMLYDVGVALVEQPVAGDAVEVMSRLSARHAIPIMADEALHGPRSAFKLAAAAAARIFAVKIAQSGGLIAAGEVASIATAAGIGLYGGTMLEAGVGTAASAHLFATFPELEWGSELFGPLLLTEEILSEPLSYENFELQVPNGHGLGVSLDDDKVAYFRRDMNAPRVHALREKV